MKLKQYYTRASGAVTTRIRRFVTSKIPFNQSYLPKRVVRLRSLDSCIAYFEIHPPYTSTLDLPEEFVADCSASLKPVRTVEFDADYVAVIPNGRVYAHDPNNLAIISEGNELISEASFQWERDSWLDASQNEIMSLRGITSPRRVKGVVCSLQSIGAVKHYYYFWITELLPKLYLLRQSGLLETIDYFIVPYYRNRYQREYLDHFGIKSDRVIDEEVYPHVQADKMVITSFTGRKAHYPVWAFNFVHRSLCPVAQTPSALLYISRKDAIRNRPVVNDDELVKLLSGYGFSVLQLTAMTIHDQAKAFNSAAVVVGAHGAGLVNLVYCQPGTRVFELFPSNYVRHGYHDLSRKMQLEYHYLLCKPDREADHHLEGQRVGLTVDLIAVERKLKEFGLRPDCYQRRDSSQETI